MIFGPGTTKYNCKSTEKTRCKSATPRSDSSGAQTKRSPKSTHVKDVKKTTKLSPRKETAAVDSSVFVADSKIYRSAPRPLSHRLMESDNGKLQIIADTSVKVDKKIRPGSSVARVIGKPTIKGAGKKDVLAISEIHQSNDNVKVAEHHLDSADGRSPRKDGTNPSKDGTNPSKDGTNPSKDSVHSKDNKISDVLKNVEVTTSNQSKYKTSPKRSAAIKPKEETLLYRVVDESVSESLPSFKSIKEDEPVSYDEVKVINEAVVVKKDKKELIEIDEATPIITKYSKGTGYIEKAGSILYADEKDTPVIVYNEVNMKSPSPQLDVVKSTPSPRHSEAAAKESPLSNDANISPSTSYSDDKVTTPSPRYNDAKDSPRYNEAKDSPRYIDATDYPRYNEAKYSPRYNETKYSPRYNDAKDSPRYNETALTPAPRYNDDYDTSVTTDGEDGSLWVRGEQDEDDDPYEGDQWERYDAGVPSNRVAKDPSRRSSHTNTLSTAGSLHSSDEDLDEYDIPSIMASMTAHSDDGLYADSYGVEADVDDERDISIGGETDVRVSALVKSDRYSTDSNELDIHTHIYIYIYIYIYIL